MPDIGDVAPRCLVSGLKSAVLLLLLELELEPAEHASHTLAACWPLAQDTGTYLRCRILGRNKIGRLHDSVLGTFSQ